jgi:predicted metalloprotease with PDZ domain
MEFSKYWYIVHHVENGGGGLEHSNSSAVVMQRFAYTDPVKYDNFISLCAHEYFHAWNVKRIRPIELGPFDYNNEVYTKQLWVAEGITSYYDELLMLRAGFWNKEKYLQNLAAKLNYNDNTPGAKIQSLAESSMDAWIKFYRPDENSANVSISYYTKGALVAALLDLSIMQQTKGAKNLDNLMQFLYNEYHIKKKRGFTEQEFIEAAESIANTKLKTFFDTWVYGTKTIDYSTYFKNFGIIVNRKNMEGSYLGTNTKTENGKQIVRSVDSNSPAFSLGLTLNDEIVTVNGYRITDDFTKYIQTIAIGTEINLTILRNGKEINIKTKTIANPKVNYTLSIDKDINNEQKRMLQIWLGKITE